MANTSVCHQFSVEGMCCAEEAGALRREIEAEPGVESLQVDLIDKRLSVVCDPDSIGAEQVIAAVKRAGMRATPWAKRGEPAEKTLWQRHGQTIMTMASGLLTGTGAALHWLSLPWGEIPAERACFALATIAGGWFVAPRAARSLRRLRFDMNVLMSVAVLGAIGIGEWFEAATVAFLFSLSLLLESWSVGRARRAVEALMDLTPPLAHVLSEGGEMRDIAVADVAPSAVIMVRPGERVPLDGAVVKGTPSIDQAPITGESLPVTKGEGDEVFAGTINGHDAFEMRVSRRADETLLARIVHQIREAQSRRGQREQWIDRFAQLYTPAMILISVGLMIAPPLLAGANWGDWFYRGLVILVISCPCALVISTPVTVVAGIAAAARRGVLIKGGAFLEIPASLHAMALDKTGTLTTGRLTVQEVIPLNGHTREELLDRAASLEANSGHPIARAICREVEGAGKRLIPAEGHRLLPGLGAEGEYQGREFWIGSERLMRQHHGQTTELQEALNGLESSGRSVVLLGNADHVCGLIGVADSLRDEAPRALEELHRLGVKHIALLTGDNETSANTIARLANVDQVLANLLPDEKVAAVEELAKEYGLVAMVGDGVNDAPAMARSSLGIAMGAAGSDAAIETADIALMSDDLTALPWLMRHSRRALTLIKQNVVFAMGIKLAFLGLAAGGLATLWMAIAADMGASLLVIFNGLRILRAHSE